MNLAKLLLLVLFLIPAACPAQSESLFSLSDLSIRDITDGIPIDLNGESITLSEPGTYTVSGTVENGSITIDAQDDGIVYLLLNGISITNRNGSVLHIKNAGKVILTLIEGTENVLICDESTDSDRQDNAAVLSNCDLTINGSGSLTVYGNNQDGILCRNWLRIISGNVTVYAQDNAITVGDAVCIGGGCITATAIMGNGIKAAGNSNSDSGRMIISGGSLHIITGKASNAWLPEEGVLVHENTAEESRTSRKGLKAENLIQIIAGNLTIDTEEDAIYSGGDIVIEGGILNLNAGDNGIRADSTMIMSDGTVNIAHSLDGLKATQFLISGGTLQIISTDDGINVGYIPSSAPQMMTFSSNDTGLSSRHIQTSDMFSSMDGSLNITGGVLQVISDGDGIDASGNLTMSGGEVYILSSENNKDAALDYDGIFTLTGGTVIALGAASAAKGVSHSSIPGTMLNVTSGSLTVSTEEGTQLLSFDAEGSYENAVIYSERLTTNETYVVTTGSYTKSVRMTLESTTGQQSLSER